MADETIPPNRPHGAAEPEQQPAEKPPEIRGTEPIPSCPRAKLDAPPAKIPRGEFSARIAAEQRSRPIPAWSCRETRTGTKSPCRPRNAEPAA